MLSFFMQKNIAFASSHQRRDGPENNLKPPVSEHYYAKRYNPSYAINYIVEMAGQGKRCQKKNPESVEAYILINFR